MTLPTFLGIGAPRAGTTWLHTMLTSHPHVYMPTRRKEVRFFDRYYERGVQWYETFFCAPEEADRYRAIGEYSPQYLECEACPERIFMTIPDSKLIVMLRHPVDRAYSQYGFFVKSRNFTGSFEDFIAAYPRAMERGFYSRYLRRYLGCFERESILALVFEDAVADVSRTRKALADFFEIARDDFPQSAGNRKVNPSVVPNLQFLYGIVAMSGRQLRRWRLESIVDIVKRSPIPRILAKGDPLPSLDNELKRNLSQLYQDEFDELEQCMQIDLSSWRN